MALTSATSSAQATREVHYSSRSIVQVNARLRFTTMIVLPEKEEILDFVCGDKDFWIVSGGQNLAYVKPAKAGATTNLNLVTSTGSIYSFLLTEGTGDPDLKLYIAPDDRCRRRRRHEEVLHRGGHRARSSGRGGRPEGSPSGSSGRDETGRRAHRRL
jgi:hypothetical protein